MSVEIGNVDRASKTHIPANTPPLSDSLAHILPSAEDITSDGIYFL